MKRRFELEWPDALGLKWIDADILLLCLQTETCYGSSSQVTVWDVTVRDVPKEVSKSPGCCGSCRFWDRSPVAPRMQGRCCRQSPQGCCEAIVPKVPVTGTRNIVQNCSLTRTWKDWPETDCDNWCGEFKAVGQVDG